MSKQTGTPVLIYLPEDVHAKAKSRAALGQVNLKDWLLEAIVSATKQKDNYATTKSKPTRHSK